MKQLFLGSDHAGFKLKEVIKKYLTNIEVPFEDLGNTVLQKDDDYPDYGYKVAKKVAEKNGLGILICGSSIGVCIVANKVKGVRAAPVSTTREAELSKEHNNANVMCLSGWNTSPEKAKKIVRTWLNAKMSQAERHNRRVQKIKKIESKEFK